ncbi:hypothetical protein M8494_11715 [Serratia ureilytica]
MIGGIMHRRCRRSSQYRPPSSYQPPADAQHLYIQIHRDSKKAPAQRLAREATVEQFPISEGVAGVDADA